MEITQLSPAENDTALAAILDERDKHASYAQRHMNEIANLQRHIERVRETEHLDEAGKQDRIETLERIIDREREQLRVRRDEIAKLDEQARPYEDAYAEQRWSRFYLVKNANGHVHKDMACSTCFYDTQYGWLYECSGMTEEEIVAEFGEKVCTVCYPAAPVTPGLVGRRDREAQEAKDAEKAAKLAAKLEKAILPDGSPLRLQDGTECKTLISAQRQLSHLLQNIEWYDSHPWEAQWQADCITLSNAIAAKTGGNGPEIYRLAQEKAIKKVAKERV